MLAMLFAQRYILGKLKWTDIPAALRDQVIVILQESGMSELIPKLT